MRGRVFLHRRGDSVTGFVRLLRVQRAASSPLVKDGSRDDVVVTLRPARFMGVTLDTGVDTETFVLLALLKNDADAAHLCFYASGEWPSKLARGELSPEYEAFWSQPAVSKPEPSKTKASKMKPSKPSKATKPTGIWR